MVLKDYLVRNKLDLVFHPNIKYSDFVENNLIIG